MIKVAVDEVNNNISNVIPISRSTKTELNKFQNPKSAKEPVIVDKIEWKILESKNLGTTISTETTNDSCKTNSQHTFIYVKYQLRNVNKIIVTVPKSILQLYDEHKNIYNVSSKTYTCLLEKTSATDKYAPDFLRTNQSKVYEVIYEVPTNAQKLHLKVGDLSIFKNEYEYILLEF